MNIKYMAVQAETLKRLKILAAKQGKTMLVLLDEIVTQYSNNKESKL